MAIDYNADELRNKTLTSPVIQGTVGAGTGLVMPAFTASSTAIINGVTNFASNVGIDGTLKVTGATNVGTFGASGVANFNSNVGIVGTAAVTGTTTLTGNTYMTNANFDGTITWGSAMVAATNGLALNANFYVVFKDVNGNSLYLPCANAAW